jgi:hypothetical protein
MVCGAWDAWCNVLMSLPFFISVVRQSTCAWPVGRPPAPPAGARGGGRSLTLEDGSDAMYGADFALLLQDEAVWGGREGVASTDNLIFM